MKQVCAQMTGTMWKILVSVGDQVEEEQEIAIMESMKMEIPVESTDSGTVMEVKVKEGDVVNEGDVIAIIE